MLQIKKFSVITFIPMLFSLALLSLTFPSVAVALSSDHTKPIKIKADSASINEKTGVSVYRGNVIFSQGSLIIKGNKVIIHQDAGSISKILVTGKLASFQQQQDNQNELVKAKAGEMEYITKDEKVYLSQNASVSQGDNLLKGNEIEYNTRTSTVTAQKSKNNTNRVHVVIEPDTGPVTAPKNSLIPKNSPNKETK